MKNIKISNSLQLRIESTDYEHSCILGDSSKDGLYIILDYNDGHTDNCTEHISIKEVNRFVDILEHIQNVRESVRFAKQNSRGWENQIIYLPMIESQILWKLGSDVYVDEGLIRQEKSKSLCPVCEEKHQDNEEILIISNKFYHKDCISTLSNSLKELWSENLHEVLRESVDSNLD